MIRLHFVLADATTRTVEADDGFTVMEVARQADVPGIVAECGGGALCSTCHVHIAPEWTGAVGPPSLTEDMILELAPDRDETSRLSCQIVVSEALDGLTMRVPAAQAT